MVVVCHLRVGRDRCSLHVYKSRTDCMRGLAEIKVEGPPPRSDPRYEEPYAAGPGTWTISSLIPSGS